LTREMEQHITDDLPSLLAVLPPEIADAVEEIGRLSDLLEVILDLGRVPTARYTDGEYTLLSREVVQEDLDLTVMQVGEFDADNRAGIERTLHRISGIRNRRGEIVGLTCRVGRAVYGTIDIIKDIIQSGRSILFLGKPGVGKTTMLREAARVLADTKRVVIVDTSNEIGGDGDVSHPAVGKARRMQVPTPSLQHEVMIEAVENHNPEVIVIDEIGRELEALAARTIAERGVQLIGTAHGITLDNLLLNPTLSDLVGGIESVTLSDEEARRRGTQKTVLERRAPPTFEVLIEIQERNLLNIHQDVALAVDSLLRGHPLATETRRREADGKITVETPKQDAPKPNGRKRRKDEPEIPQSSYSYRTGGNHKKQQEPELSPRPNNVPQAPPKAVENTRTLQVYPYGIARNRLIDSAHTFNVPLRVVDTLKEADVLLTLKNFYRRRPRLVVDAEQRGIPIYVLRSNTVAQIEDFLIDYFNLDFDQEDDHQLSRALREVDEAIDAVLAGDEAVDLSPQKASIRRQQHEIVRRAKLSSHSYGKEPQRHLRIFRDYEGG
jgi:stage III sporulation protein SpoIIIAA